MGVNDYIQIGNRIKEARKKANKRQKEVAKILNIPISTYSGYENNHREPSTEMLGRIAEVLGVSVDWLIYGERSNITNLFTGGPEIGTLFLKNAEELLKTSEDISLNVSEIIKTVGQSVIDNAESILEAYSKLNEKGKQKAVEYTNDLTHIEEYTKPDTTGESNSDEVD